MILKKYLLLINIIFFLHTTLTMEKNQQRKHLDPEEELKNLIAQSELLTNQRQYLLKKKLNLQLQIAQEKIAQEKIAQEKKEIDEVCENLFIIIANYIRPTDQNYKYTHNTGNTGKCIGCKKQEYYWDILNDYTLDGNYCEKTINNLPPEEQKTIKSLFCYQGNACSWSNTNIPKIFNELSLNSIFKIIKLITKNYRLSLTDDDHVIKRLLKKTPIYNQIKCEDGKNFLINFQKNIFKGLINNKIELKKFFQRGFFSFFENININHLFYSIDQRDDNVKLKGIFNINIDFFSDIANFLKTNNKTLFSNFYEFVNIIKNTLTTLEEQKKSLVEQQEKLLENQHQKKELQQKKIKITETMRKLLQEDSSRLQKMIQQQSEVGLIYLNIIKETKCFDSNHNFNAFRKINL